MATTTPKRLRPDILTADGESFIALKDLKDYAPANKAFTTATIEASHANMILLKEKEILASLAYKALVDDATAAEQLFHDNILGAKTQVKAQYGDNSNEVQALGLKKKNERKKNVRSAKPATP